MYGMNLVGGDTAIDSGRVVTGHPNGTTGGRLWRLTLAGIRRNETRIESSSEQVAGDNHLLSYDLDALSPGVYKVESPSDGVIYFRITSDPDIERLRNESAAWRSLQR